MNAVEKFLYGYTGRPGQRTDEQKKKVAKQQAVRKAGKKIKGKEAEELKKMGVTKKDIKAYRYEGQGNLSRRGSKVFDTKFEPKKEKSKPSASKSSEPSYEKQFQAQQDRIAEMMESFQISQQQTQKQYEKMLAKQAAQAKKDQEEQLKMLQIQQQNTAAAARMPNFQLQGAGTAPKLGAAQQFRRRLGSQFGTGSPYTGLAQISSGMVNV